MLYLSDEEGLNICFTSQEGCTEKIKRMNVSKGVDMYIAMYAVMYIGLIKAVLYVVQNVFFFFMCI